HRSGLMLQTFQAASASATCLLAMLPLGDEERRPDVQRLIEREPPAQVHRGGVEVDVYGVEGEPFHQTVSLAALQPGDDADAGELDRVGPGAGHQAGQDDLLVAFEV